MERGATKITTRGWLEGRMD